MRPSRQNHFARMYQAASEAEHLTGAVRQADEESRVPSILLEETNQTQKFSHEEQDFTLTGSNEDAAIMLPGRRSTETICVSLFSDRGVGENGTIERP
jgi:hypothetical protein